MLDIAKVFLIVFYIGEPDTLNILQNMLNNEKHVNKKVSPTDSLEVMGRVSVEYSGNL